MKKLNLLKLSLVFLLFAGFMTACTPATSTTQEENKEENTTQEENKEENSKKEEKEQKDPVATATALQEKIDKKLKKLTVKEIKGEDGPGFLKLKFYHKGDKINKIEYSSGGDHGGASESYYFNAAGKLLLVNFNESGWHFSMEKEGATEDESKEYIFYYDNKGNAVKASLKEASALSDKFEKALATAEFKDYATDKGSDLASRAATLKKLFTEAPQGPWEGIPYFRFNE